MLGEYHMEKVLGIGGVFFRAKDPDALTKWYAQHLGISPSPTSDGEEVWQQQAGPTVFTPFDADTDYWDSKKGWMMNFRVRDLNKLVEQLRGAGIEVEVNPDETYGRFARVHDPEGNAIELWQEV
jgi:predicted enzyme related to lactoylglutathione lyase